MKFKLFVSMALLISARTYAMDDNKEPALRNLSPRIEGYGTNVKVYVPANVDPRHLAIAQALAREQAIEPNDAAQPAQERNEEISPAVPQAETKGPAFETKQAAHAIQENSNNGGIFDSCTIL